MRNQPGDVVWLSAFDNGEEIVERQQATILAKLKKGLYLVRVAPEGEGDDGLREVAEDQIER